LRKLVGSLGEARDIQEEHRTMGIFDERRTTRFPPFAQVRGYPLWQIDG
jgi:hypothetical protein